MKRFLVAVVAAVLTAVTFATPAAAFPPSLVVVYDSEVNADPQSFTFGKPVCPTRTHLLGAGADVTGGGHSIRIVGIKPDTEASGDFVWTTAGGDSSGLRAPYSLDASAICGGGVTGWQIVEASSPSDSSSAFAVATAVCPAGKLVSGAGGRSWKSWYIVDSIDISSDLTRVTVEVVTDATFPPEQAGAQAFAYAICIDPLPGQQRVYAESVWDSSDKHVSVQCPQGARVIGLGGGLTGAAGAAYLDRLAPIAPDGSNLGSGLGFGGADIDAREISGGAPQDWRAYVYAVCVDALHN